MGKWWQTLFFWAPESLQMVMAAMKLRRLLFGRKVMTNLDNILKSRHIILSAKVHLVKAMVFPVVMYGCESWSIKKAECRRIDAFELWCWRRLLRVSWPEKRSNQSILKEISPEYSLEGLMLCWISKCLGHLMWRTDSSEKTLMLGMIEGGRRGDDRGWDGWMASPTQWTWIWVNSRSWWWTGKHGMLQSMGLQSLTRLNDWTEDSNTLALFPTSSHKFSSVMCSLLLYNSRCFPLPLPAPYF